MTRWYLTVRCTIHVGATRFGSSTNRRRYVVCEVLQHSLSKLFLSTLDCSNKVSQYTSRYSPLQILSSTGRLRVTKSIRGTLPSTIVAQITMAVTQVTFLPLPPRISFCFSRFYLSPRSGRPLRLLKQLKKKPKMIHTAGYKMAITMAILILPRGYQHFLYGMYFLTIPCSSEHLWSLFSTLFSAFFT